MVKVSAGCSFGGVFGVFLGCFMLNNVGGAGVRCGGIGQPAAAGCPMRLIRLCGGWFSAVLKNVFCQNKKMAYICKL